MVRSFQIDEGWLYILREDGTLARRYLKQSASQWEKVELPVDLVEPKQQNAGIKNNGLSIRNTK